MRLPNLVDCAALMGVASCHPVACLRGDRLNAFQYEICAVGASSVRVFVSTQPQYELGFTRDLTCWFVAVLRARLRTRYEGPCRRLCSEHLAVE